MAVGSLGACPPFGRCHFIGLLGVPMILLIRPRPSGGTSYVDYFVQVDVKDSDDLDSYVLWKGKSAS